MENRFGVKDFFLFLIITALLVSVWIGMKQYDRQWTELQSIRSRLDSQATDLRDIQSTLSRGVRTANPNATSSTTQPTTSAFGDPADDPFSRLLEARKMQGFAMGDWLVDAFGSTVGNLTPLLSSDAYAGQVQGYVFESLIDRDPATLEWKPLLAQSWQIVDRVKEFQSAVDKLKADGKTSEEIAKDASVPDALEIKFKMRPGVQFSDGQPLTADDVIFTFNFIMDPKINSPREKAYYSRIREVKKTAPDEVTFYFREPYFEAFSLAGGLQVMPRHFYGTYTAENFNNSVGLLMGSGPYRLRDSKNWKPGTLIELVRNERYWGVQPAFDRFVFKEITNDVARQLAFRNGDIDLFGAFPEQYRQMIADAPLVERTQHYDYQSPVGGYRYIAWNEKISGKPSRFADKRVRQAMTMLLDRNRMLQEVMLGYGVLSTGPFNPQSKQFNQEIKPWPYDVDRAKQLLKDAGFADRNNDGVIEDTAGVPFSFRLTYPSGNANYEKMVLFVKDSFARAGIVCNPDPLDFSVLVERLKKKNFEAITLGWTAGIETDIFQMFHSTQMIEEGDNFMSYVNPELDKIIDEARITIDEDKRMALWRRAHEIMHEDQPYTFLFFGKSLVFIDKRISNVQLVKMGLNPRVEWFVASGVQKYRN